MLLGFKSLFEPQQGGVDNRAVLRILQLWIVLLLEQQGNDLLLAVTDVLVYLGFDFAFAR